mgnify:CR=1 FL=1
MSLFLRTMIRLIRVAFPLSGRFRNTRNNLLAARFGYIWRHMSTLLTARRCRFPYRFGLGLMSFRKFFQKLLCCFLRRSDRLGKRNYAVLPCLALIIFDIIRAAAAKLPPPEVIPKVKNEREDIAASPVEISVKSDILNPKISTMPFAPKSDDTIISNAQSISSSAHTTYPMPLAPALFLAQ